jgi:hypothetical protein
VLGWTSPLVLFGFAYAPAALIAFLRWEGKVASPLLRTDYLRRRNFSAPVATQFFSNFAYMGGFIITPAVPGVGLRLRRHPDRPALDRPALRLLGGRTARWLRGAAGGGAHGGIFGAGAVTVSMVGSPRSRRVPGTTGWCCRSPSPASASGRPPLHGRDGGERRRRGRPRGGRRHPAAHHPGGRGGRHPADADAAGLDARLGRPRELVPLRLPARRGRLDARHRLRHLRPPLAPGRGEAAEGAGVAVVGDGRPRLSVRT